MNDSDGSMGKSHIRLPLQSSILGSNAVFYSEKYFVFISKKALFILVILVIFSNILVILLYNLVLISAV